MLGDADRKTLENPVKPPPPLPFDLLIQLLGVILEIYLQTPEKIDVHGNLLKTVCTGKVWKKSQTSIYRREPIDLNKPAMPTRCDRR